MQYKINSRYRLQGVILVLSRLSLLGDHTPFAGKYKWTTAEQEAFVTLKRVPCNVTNLPLGTLVVPFLVYIDSRSHVARAKSNCGGVYKT